jgi:nitroreductase
MLLAATALGYGTCWMEGFTLRNEEHFKELLGVPADKRLLTIIPVGVAAEAPVKEKRSLEDVLHWERF